ncbi:hypothetical protein AQUCO_03000033v1 [Aquilegia coerulea]|uniref:AMP-dependent synthetase/ligase domain-containing protein n=1 Tax=Aquilegia coerulea TaxID=218851 RepID=A0A2G5D0Y0_AQUCA|nr:hypothetical protein AQUCO_03000033v1 [Aquilegia coerulea]
MISLTKTNGKCSSRCPDHPWFYTDSWIKSCSNRDPEDISTQPESQPNDLCFLQFTSGSAGDAKGVMITHGVLIHNVKLMRRRHEYMHQIGYSLVGPLNTMIWISLEGFFQHWLQEEL